MIEGLPAVEFHLGQATLAAAIVCRLLSVTEFVDLLLCAAGTTMLIGRFYVWVVFRRMRALRQISQIMVAAL